MVQSVDPLNHQAPITVKETGAPSSFFIRQWQNLTANVTALAQAIADIASIVTLANGKIYIGNASNVATEVTPSGDWTITNTGVSTIANGAVTEDKQTLADVTTHNVSASKHGYAPKAPNDATVFLNGVGGYTAPSASAGGAMSLISSATPTGTGVVTFSSIPATFTHLLILGTGRSTAGSSVGVTVSMTLNNDTGSNYDFHELQLQNTTIGNNSAAAQTAVQAGFIPWSGATANNNGAFRIEINNYKDTSLFKHGLLMHNSIGATTLGTTWVARVGGGFMWRSTAAINRVDLTLAAGNWEAGSAISLYGLS